MSKSNFTQSADFNEDDLKKLIDSFDLDSMIQDLKNDDEFNQLLGKVPIEEDDPLYDLKSFYNEYLIGFDFDDIKKYYIKSSPDESLKNIIWNYFDFKITNWSDCGEKFNFYIDYICSFFFYHLDNNRFDEALSYIIQLAILSSNENDVDDGDILERKPHFRDVLFEINRFMDKDPTFDLNCSFKLAVDTFKVDVWLNNESEVYDAIAKLFGKNYL